MPNKKPSIRTKNFACAALALPEGTPWERNWDTGAQPTIKTIDEYRETARALRIHMLRDAERLMLLAPDARLKDDRGQEYTLTELHSLIAHLEENSDDDRFLKGEGSAERKLLDHNVNQHPEKIKDYLRFQILTNNPGEAALLRCALLSGSTGIQIASHKDQFRRPCDEGGHRAFKTHNVVSNGTHTMLAECQISIDALERAEEPKWCRNIERMMKTSSSEFGVSFKLAAAYQEIAGRMQALRKLKNWEIAEAFDCMLDSDINPEEVKREAEKAFTNGSDTSNKIMSHFSRLNTSGQGQSDSARGMNLH